MTTNNSKNTSRPSNVKLSDRGEQMASASSSRDLKATEGEKLKHSDVTLAEIREASSSQESGAKARYTQPSSDYTITQNAETDKAVRPNRGSDVIEPGLVGPHEKSQAY